MKKLPSFLSFSGINVQVSNLGTKTIPDLSAPKKLHRRPRIQKKWNKRFGFKTKEVDMDPFLFNSPHGPVLIMSQRQFDAMKKGLTP